MEYQSNLLQRFELAEGLKELADNGEDLSFLSPDMSALLDSIDQLHDEATTQSDQLTRLITTITNLYIDYERMVGRNGKTNIEKLHQILRDYNYDELLQFFKTKNSG
ncbi:hypothetical protein AB6A40_010707 [Gnathostoma spinigerum]|uniref:BBS7 helical hairpin domain-containing protein n=1 Tax=Gnathostoma spinigerum TaxID=75299 RepID=A0ABD6F291_9BILA